DPEQMRDRLERIREAGWAGQSEENDIGMNALAVPVFDLDGRLLASLALAAPVFRRSLDEPVALAPHLTEPAAAIAARIPRSPWRRSLSAPARTSPSSASVSPRSTAAPPWPTSNRCAPTPPPRRA